MSAPEKITSPQNPKIKNLKKLEKASERKEQQLVLVEGLREVVLAYRAGYEITALYICEEIFKDQEEYSLTELPTHNQNQKREAFGVQAPVEVTSYYISKAVYDSLGYRETTEGILATVKPKSNGLKDLTLGKTPLILVIEAVEKPGNLGAMLRTCDAAGVDAVIICDAKTDVYNPNVIRSSVGTVFTNQVAVCETAEAIEFLKKNGITTFAAELNATGFYYEKNFGQPSAVIVGTEAAGLSAAWIQAANERIKIPMLGKIDSLNVSVSAAVLLFEAVRQRAKK